MHRVALAAIVGVIIGLFAASCAGLWGPQWADGPCFTPWLGCNGAGNVVQEEPSPMATESAEAR